MKKLRIALAMAALAVAAEAHAADSSGSAAIYGLGGMKCRAVSTSRSFVDNTVDRQALLSWFLGYLSASNATRAGVFDLSPILSTDDLYGLLYNQCKTAPDANVQQVAANLINTLAVAKSFQFTPIVEFKNDYGTMPVRQAVVLQIQKALGEIGLFKGYMDGKPTTALSDALKKFQTQQKMPQTGLPDSETILKLTVTRTNTKPAKDSR